MRAALNAFQSGARRDATKEQKAKGRDGNCRGPNSIFLGQWYEEWLMECIRLSRDPIYADLDERLRTTYHYDSLWDFYKHIGFDYKKRKYVKKQLY